MGQIYAKQPITLNNCNDIVYMYTISLLLKLDF